MNSSALLHAAKKNDYERVKILFRYGYRLERIERITDPLKRIELFKESDTAEREREKKKSVVGGGVD